MEDLELPIKLISEVILVNFDFTSQSKWGEVISSSSVTIEVFSGVDYHPQNLLLGTTSQSGLVVTQKIQLGMAGVVYLLKAQAVGTSGNVYSVIRKLAIFADTGAFGVMTNTLSLVGVLPNAICCAPYSASLQISGGYAPYSFFRISSGTAPTWMNFAVVADQLVCSGTPDEEAIANYSFTIDIIDAAGNIASSAQTISVAMVYMTGSPPVAYYGSSYSYTFSFGSGTAPYTFSVASGRLPTDMTFVAGVLSATNISEAGAFPVTLRITDANGCHADVAMPTFTVANPLELPMLAVGFVRLLSLGSAAHGFSSVANNLPTAPVSSILAAIRVGDKVYLSGQCPTGTPAMFSAPCPSNFQTWTALTPPPGSAPNTAYSLVYGNGILASISGEVIQYSSNGGTSWSSVLTPQIDPFQAGNSCLTYENGYFLTLSQSTDGSKMVRCHYTTDFVVWQSALINVGGPGAVAGSSIVLWTGDRWIAQLSQGEIWATTNLSGGWNKVRDNTVSPVGFNGARMATNGTGMVVLNGSIGGTVKNIFSVDHGSTWQLGSYPVTGRTGNICFEAGIFWDSDLYTIDGNTWTPCAYLVGTNPDYFCQMIYYL